MHRVVVTGAGAYSPLGIGWDESLACLQSRKNCVEVIKDWDVYEGLNTRLGAKVRHFDLTEDFTRKKTRCMGRVSILATAACQTALMDAGLFDDPLLESGRVGDAYGSSTGSNRWFEFGIEAHTVIIGAAHNSHICISITKHYVSECWSLQVIGRCGTEIESVVTGSSKTSGCVRW